MDKEMTEAARKKAPIIRQAIRYYLNWRESLSFEEKFEAETGQKMYNYSKKCFDDAEKHFGRMWGK